MPESALVLGCRATDAAENIREIAGTVTKPCAQCGAATRFSPATLQRAASFGCPPTFLCVECGSQRLDGVLLLPPTVGQVAELAANGHADGWPLAEHYGTVLRRRRP